MNIIILQILWFWEENNVIESISLLANTVEEKH